MGSLSSFNGGLKYLLYVIDIFTKYAWIKPSTDKKSKTVLHGFVRVVNERKRKPNKLWVHQRRKCYNKLMQK